MQSVSEKIGVSARPTASSSTTATVIASPPAHVASLSISLERSSRSSPTTSTSARHASRSAFAPSRAKLLADPLGNASLLHVVGQQLATLFTAFASAESAFNSPATSARTVAGAGAAR